MDRDHVQLLDGNFTLLPVTEDGKLAGRARRKDLLLAVRRLLGRDGRACQREWRC